ncbi:hypothetical protein JNB11_06350 [Kocuria palustris]|nr:hypothetical protein [Kocuria palustris]
MQGSYKDKGLPRPYYMTPSKKKHSPYNDLPQNFFNSSRRKLIGYLVVLLLFGTMMWWISQDLRVQPEPIYEVVHHDDAADALMQNGFDIGNVNIKDNMKEADNADLAAGLSAGSKGDKGYAVDEAPKGGIANEDLVVGSDEDLIVGNGKAKPKQGGGVGKGKVALAPGAAAAKGDRAQAKGYKADKE